MINLSSSIRQDYFDFLLQSVNQCDLCPRMVDRKKVLSAQNGNLASKVIFIAEAPGRLGAECTGIPLYGDKTGTNFEALLSNIGWKRSDIFITNAILCNPQNSDGNNATPEKSEIINCNHYLKMVLELINPDVVVTLGAKALEALNLVCAHQFTLKNNVAKVLEWNGRILFPLYHTGSRAAIHRSLIQQRSDFIVLSHLVDPIRGLKRASAPVHLKSPKRSTCTNSTLVDMVVCILRELCNVSFFKLTKMLYLIDYYHYEKFGCTISGGIYLRMQEGPWIPYLKDIAKEYNGKLFLTQFEMRKPYLVCRESSYQINQLSLSDTAFIKEMCLKYHSTTDSQIKTFVYLTKPMKYILGQEKKGRQMSKIPVLYGDKTVIDIDLVNPTADENNDL